MPGSLCYAHMGNWEHALLHNSKAREYLPNDPGLLANQQKLEALLREGMKIQEECGDAPPYK